MPKKGKDGYYHSKVTPAIGVPPIYFRARTLREFNAKREEIIEAYKTGRISRDVPFVEIALEWWKVVKEPRLRESSRRNMWYQFNKHILQVMPSQQLCRAVRYHDLQRCVDQMQGSAKESIGTIIGMLRGICDYAVAEDAMEANYAASLRMPRAANPRRQEALTKQQAEKLRSLFSDSGNIVIALEYYCGLRKGEALGLQWGDIDWQYRRLHVTRQFNSVTLQIEEPKTERGTRWIDMPDALVQLLVPIRGLPLTYIASGEAKPMTAREHEVLWTKSMLRLGFARPKPEALSRQQKASSEGQRYHFKNTCSDYASDFTAHTLRHNFATALFRADIDPIYAMRLLGHAKYDTTLRVYTDIKNTLDYTVQMDNHLSAELKKVAKKLQNLRDGTFAIPKSP